MGPLIQSRALFASSERLYHTLVMTNAETQKAVIVLVSARGPITHLAQVSNVYEVPKEMIRKTEEECYE